MVLSSVSEAPECSASPLESSSSQGSPSKPLDGGCRGGMGLDDLDRRKRLRRDILPGDSFDGKTGFRNGSTAARSKMRPGRQIALPLFVPCRRAYSILDTCSRNHSITRTARTCLGSFRRPAIRRLWRSAALCVGVGRAFGPAKRHDPIWN
jgi:hypothetical protein